MLYFICPPGVTFILVVIRFLSWFLEHGAVPRDLPRHGGGQVGLSIAVILSQGLLKSPSSMDGKLEQKWIKREKRKNLKLGKMEET